MSGGSFGYIYSLFENEVVGKLCDPEMNDLARDLVKILHDAEWWTSGDISEEYYRKTVKHFKEKWFTDTNARRAELIEKCCEELKQELLDALT